MPQTMPRPLLADIADRTRAFVGREAGLLMPLAFATTGVASLLWDLTVPDAPAGQRVQPGAWMLILVPVTLLFLIGNIATAALVVTGGVSVREALRSAVERLGNALLIVLMFLAAALAVSVVALMIGGAGAGRAQQAAGTVATLLLPVLLFVAIRLLTLWPAIAARPARPAPIAAVRAAFGNTRGLFWRLAAVTLLYALAYLLVMTAIQFGLGSILLMLGRATGNAAAAGVVLSVVTAMAGAAIQAVWGVFAAFLYLALTADSSGT